MLEQLAHVVAWPEPELVQGELERSGACATKARANDHQGHAGVPFLPPSPPRKAGPGNPAPSTSAIVTRLGNNPFPAGGLALAARPLNCCRSHHGEGVSA